MPRSRNTFKGRRRSSNTELLFAKSTYRRYFRGSSAKWKLALARPTGRKLCVHRKPVTFSSVLDEQPPRILDAFLPVVDHGQPRFRTMHLPLFPDTMSPHSSARITYTSLYLVPLYRSY